MTNPYLVRIKEHLDAERATSLVHVMSLYSLRLGETANSREYVVTLAKPDKAAKLERTLEMWEGAGFAEWRRLEE